MNGAPLWQTRARGKLLLTGEYAVLDGALALALPVRYGQSLVVEPDGKPGQLLWLSRNEQGEIWFQAKFSLPGLAPLQSTGKPTAEVLQQLLLACRRQNPDFLNTAEGLRATTQTDFPRAWGLGTSSTLIAALARWADADPYRVLSETLGGSGYDIACAYADGPLLYRLTNRGPEVQPAHFAPPFAADLYFVFLGKKQNSREAIRHYREFAHEHETLAADISALTRQCLQARTLDEFTATLLEHERLIGAATGLPRAQELYFPDFPGVVKSLGAWGGDFVLAAGAGGAEAVREYFREKGFGVCLGYGEMV